VNGYWLNSEGTTRYSEEYGCKHIPNASHTGTKSSISPHECVNGREQAWVVFVLDLIILADRVWLSDYPW